MWDMYSLREVLVYIPSITQEQTRSRTRALKESVRAGYLVTDTAQCSPEIGVWVYRFDCMLHHLIWKS